jgi:predicted TIM-barrel fold metal-dependent hydrolase
LNDKEAVMTQQIKLIDAHTHVLDLICDDEEMRAKIGHGNSAHVFRLSVLP